MFSFRTVGLITAGAITTGAALAAMAGFPTLAQAQERSSTVEVITTDRSPERNCRRLIRRLDRIDDNSAERRYLFIIDPGLLDCGDSQIVMKEFVDIEGSGRGVTTLLGSAVADSFIFAANNSELRSLSVEAIASGQGVTGIVIDGFSGSNNARITDVAVNASGGDFTTAIGTSGPGAAAVLTNVEATTTDSNAAGEEASAAAIVVNEEAGLVMIDSKAIGDPLAENSFGLDVFGGSGGSTVTVRNSVLSGRLADLIVNPADTLNIISTQLTGAEQSPGGGGALNCVGAYDGNFQPLDEICQEIVGTAFLTIDGDDPFNFGFTLVNTNAFLSFQLSNEGDGTATSIAEVGLEAPFRFRDGVAYPGTGGTCGDEILAGESCTIFVEFFPTVPGTFNGQLDLQYDDGQDVQSVTKDLQGEGF